MLLTDGENNAGRIPPTTAAEAVKALKIRFYAIGAGINGIAPAPVFNPRTGKPFTDVLGNIMYQNQRVQFNETGLKEVAKIAEGQFFRATDTKSLEQIFQDIDKIGENDGGGKKISAIPRPLSRLHHGRLRLARRPDFVVADDLEETAVKTTRWRP